MQNNPHAPRLLQGLMGASVNTSLFMGAVFQTPARCLQNHSVGALGGSGQCARTMLQVQRRKEKAKSLGWHTAK